MKWRASVIILCLLILSSYRIHGQSDPIDDGNIKDIPIKGFHLDLRIQVMKMDALKMLANQLSSMGINTIVMEWEGTFPYEAHPLIPNQYAYSKEEIKDFIAFCHQLQIEVIPLQQTLGHLEYVLRHYRYAKQREDEKDFSQLCPMEYDSNEKLFSELFTELEELHTSEFIHIGADEAYFLGHCEKCQKRVAEVGVEELFADHLKMVCDLVVGMGKRPVLWADIALKYPDALSKLPKGTVFIDWNYGWEINRFGELDRLKKLGFEMWGAPAIRSNPDNYYLTRWEYHMNNIRDFIPHCRQNGYTGIIMTSWSTSGVYFPILEDHHTITNEIPIRRVYPISGFNLLITAYSQSLQESEPLNIDRFIEDYGKSRFGFNIQQSQEFWEALVGYPFLVANGQVLGNEMTMGQLLEGVRQNLKTLQQLDPQDHQEEFAHFLLMTEIRENYLAFKMIESKVNHPDFAREAITEVLKELDDIKTREKMIHEKFIQLNSPLLYSSEIEIEHEQRSYPVILLYNRLSKSR